MNNKKYDAPVRPMRKSELARLYFPNSHTTHSAVNALMGWVAYNRKLSEALRLTGYNKLQRYLTREQVELIYEYLGEP